MAAVTKVWSRAFQARSWAGCLFLACTSACGGSSEGANGGNNGGDNGVTNPPVKTSGVGVSFSPGTMSLAAGTTDTVLINLARTNFTGAVSLGVSGAPAGLTVGLAPPIVMHRK